MPSASPESVVHDLFRDHQNHFPQLEDAADEFRAGETIETGELYSYLKARLMRRQRHQGPHRAGGRDAQLAARIRRGEAA